MKLKNIIFLLNQGLFFCSNGHICNVFSTLSKVVPFNVEIRNFVSTLLSIVNFNVEVRNVFSTSIWRCATSRHHINLKATLNRRWNVCLDEPGLYSLVSSPSTLFNMSKIIISSIWWFSQNSTSGQSAIANSMHLESKYTLTPPLPKHSLCFKQPTEDLRNIFTGPRKKILNPHQKQKVEMFDWYLILNSWIEALLTFYFSGAIVPKFHTYLEAIALDF